MSEDDSDSNSDLENEKGIEINKNLYNSIKDTFDEELYKIFKKIVLKYGQSYLFTYEDLITFYKQYTIKFTYRIALPNKKNKTDNENDTDNDIDNEIRCCARIWCGGYMNKETNQYGSRCQRKKNINSNSDYCRQHQENLTHGRFDEEPSKIVKGFYIKENSYYNTSE
jgi:hypothetical protein